MLSNRVVRLAALALATTSLQPAVAQEADDPVLTGFADPPHEARPHVWWHWMNGNITEDGIAKDIEWMRRIGIGGLQNFDADLYTPQVVENRLVYMTPEWKRAFRFAAQRAQAAGLELAIAGSPGWSETGGPWVPPEDGIKKLSWSETLIEGRRRFDGRIDAAPGITGPFQTMGKGGPVAGGVAAPKTPQMYRDIAVLAVPVLGRGASASYDARDGAGREVATATLADNRYDDAVGLGAGTQASPPVLNIRYNRPYLARSATLLLRDASSTTGPFFSPVLEARISGTWRHVAELAVVGVPTTVAFRAVRAREFRVVFRAFDGPSRPSMLTGAPGAVVPAMFAPDTSSKPVKVAEFALSGDAKVDRFEAKAGFALVNEFAAISSTAVPGEAGVKPAQVIDLTKRMRADGTLDWTPPAGKWRVIRLGWSLTGQTNHPAPVEATGLEVDKLDGEAVSRYLRTYLNTYKDAAGSDMVGARGLRALLLDSTEVGTFNWTPRMIEHFRRLRGYDPMPWLPTLTGVVIGSRAQSDRFLYDFRRTLTELHATEHYATVARIAHEYGLKVYSEALEDQRPVIGDDMAMRRYADIPMAALWTWKQDGSPRPTLLGDMKGASSVGHLYGKNIIAAESLTSAIAPWADSPATLRRAIDLEFAHGINRPIIHTSVHQPADKKPGLSLSIVGQFFNRHESWGEMAKPWVDYIARASFLLQQGRNAADVAYFHGEEAPITGLTAHGTPTDTPVRFAYDYVNVDALVDLLKVENGDLAAPSGARYRVLYLGPGTRAMTLPTLRRIAALVGDGATLVGSAPVDTPSLADDRSEFAKLVARLWSGLPTTQVGKGRVIASRNVEEALSQLGVVPDLDVGTAAAKDVMFVHRRLADGELYFLVNRAKRPLQIDARFRVDGKAPEIWHADTGKVSDVSYSRAGSVTTVPLSIGAERSVFVMFRKESAQPSRVINEPMLKPLVDLSTGWTVSFQSGRGAPSSITLPTLKSLSEHALDGVKYFSGEALYTRRFTAPTGSRSGTPLWLDLGQVGDLAEVRINGKLAGAPWQAPYRVDIAPHIRAGENILEIKVANRWINRLIGDMQPGAAKVTFTTIPTYQADAPLRASGLIGPVRILGNAE